MEKLKDYTLAFGLIFGLIGGAMIGSGLTNIYHSLSKPTSKPQVVYKIDVNSDEVRDAIVKTNGELFIYICSNVGNDPCKKIESELEKLANEVK